MMRIAVTPLQLHKQTIRWMKLLQAIDQLAKSAEVLKMLLSRFKYE